MNSRRMKSSLVSLKVFSLVALLVLQTLPRAANAQQEAPVFALPVASVSSLYQVSIAQVLRENYRLKLESTAQAQGFRWYFHSGALPLGLRITPDGNIVGRPRSARPEPYKFRVKVINSAVTSDELTLTFELKVEPSRIRLGSTDAPRLVPVEDPSEESSGNRARISFSDKVGQLWNANHGRAGNSSDSATLRVEENARPSSPAPDSARYPVPAGNGSLLTNDRTLPASTDSVTTASAAPADDPSCPSCLPTPPPNESKDFIINARTGETSGKKKFRLRDNARIIVIEKNPFLYEYKVTLKDKVIVESAIAEFFKGWPLSVDDAKKPEEAKTPNTEAVGSCSLVTDSQFDRFAQLQRWLAGRWAELDTDYSAEKQRYEAIAKSVEADKKVVYNENTDCSTVCRKATSIRTTLAGYDPDLDTLSKRVANLKLYANMFQEEVDALIRRVRNNPEFTSASCTETFGNFRASAAGYLKVATDMEAGVQKMTSGKNAFDAIVNTINKVFSDPHAFYQIYNRGDYGLPTDVEITVERKEITKEDGKFIKIIDAETINFGGGPRFALAGGVVVSPLETIEFKRVPALVNGQQTTIIGREESSSSRILPMLMLHGRVAEGRGPISGFHFSLGVTAKPTDSDTNVEFLIGPSVSFIEERLFFTFGGYAGRRKQLEGNLVPDQELPKDFGDEIPTSKHLVWKPGFALTYKFK